MGAGHDHGSGHLSAGGRHRNRLLLAFAIIIVFFVVEVVVGIAANSLALLSDAGHMFTDVIGLGMALAAIHLAGRHDSDAVARTGNTFGLYRLEILAAFVNALLLFGVAIWVLVEAVRRLFEPAEVLGVPMFVVAVLGLVANIVAFLLLREGSKESLNVEGAALEVLADTIGSIGVILAAVALQVFGWSWVDPVVAALIGLWILPRTWHLGRRAVRILIEAAPEGVDLEALAADLTALDGVVDVHDLHVWTLTSGMDSASVHLAVCAGTDNHAVLDQARELLADRYHVAHATLQVEPDSHRGCDDVAW